MSNIYFNRVKILISSFLQNIKMFKVQFVMYQLLWILTLSEMAKLLFHIFKEKYASRILIDGTEHFFKHVIL